MHKNSAASVIVFDSQPSVKMELCIRYYILHAIFSLRTLCFSSVQALLLHFSRNFGAETSVIYYIGMKGEFSKVHKYSTM